MLLHKWGVRHGGAGVPPHRATLTAEYSRNLDHSRGDPGGTAAGRGRSARGARGARFGLARGGPLRYHHRVHVESETGFARKNEGVFVQALKLGLAILVILGCGLYLTYWQANKPQPGAEVPNLKPLMCAACGEKYIARVGDEPVACRKCGAKSVWRAQECLKCKEIFPKVRNDAAGSDNQAPVACPKCGSTQMTDPEPDKMGGLPPE